MPLKGVSTPCKHRHFGLNTTEFLIIVSAIIAFNVGCASSKTTKEQTPVRSLSDIQIERRPCQEMRSETGKTFGRPAVHVRLATESEVYSVPRFVLTKTGAGLGALGAGGFALGFVAPPLYVSSLIVGGVLITGMTAILASDETRAIRTIEGVMSSLDFPALVEEAIKAKFNGSVDGEATGYKLTVLILGYGFTKKYPGAGPPELCFTMDAEIVFTEADTEIYRDLVFMEPFIRSEDTPPPPCARMEDLAENEGGLAREMIIEQIAILSAIVAHRLPALPWKDW